MSSKKKGNKEELFSLTQLAVLILSATISGFTSALTGYFLQKPPEHRTEKPLEVIIKFNSKDNDLLLNEENIKEYYLKEGLKDPAFKKISDRAYIKYDGTIRPSGILAISPSDNKVRNIINALGLSERQNNMVLDIKEIRIEQGIHIGRKIKS
jgi:hypothetical protein